MELGWDFFHNLLLRVLKIQQPVLLGLEENELIAALKALTLQGARRPREVRPALVPIDWLCALLDAKGDTLYPR